MCNLPLPCRIGWRNSGNGQRLRHSRPPDGRAGGPFPCASASSRTPKLVLPTGPSGAIKASDFGHEPLTGLCLRWRPGPAKSRGVPMKPADQREEIPFAEALERLLWRAPSWAQIKAAEASL